MVLSWKRVLPLLAAIAFVAVALGLFLGTDRPPGRSSVDVGFLQDMISHHEQAIEMSLVASERAGDAQVRGFAREILVAQSREIGIMLDTLQRWGFEAGEPDRTVMRWMGMARPAAQMPGLASAAEMDGLARASETVTSTMFLGLMIEHHLGGVEMAQHAADVVNDRRIGELAGAMARNQRLEVEEYQRLLTQLGGGIAAAGSGGAGADASGHAHGG